MPGEKEIEVAAKAIDKWLESVKNIDLNCELFNPYEVAKSALRAAEKVRDGC